MEVSSGTRRSYETESRHPVSRPDPPVHLRVVEWREIRPGYSKASGRDDTCWEIIEESGRFGVIVAQWDKPDWWADSLEDAKDLAEARDAAPDIPAEQWLPEIPFG